MRVLLCQPLGSLREPSVHIRMCYVEPLGLEYITSALQEAGHNVRLAFPIDSIGELKREIAQDQPDVVCISVYTYARDEATTWAKTVKEISPSTIVVMGGHHPTAVPEDVLGPYVDFAVIGEGEHTITHLLEAIGKGSDPNEVQGIAYLLGTQLVRTSARPRIHDIDALPYPHRMRSFLSEAKNYQVIVPPPSKQVSLAQVFYSRGCPNNCEFCSSALTWGRTVVWRKPDIVLDEIEKLQQDYGTNVVYFPDLELNTSPKKLHELCDEFQKRNLGVSWWGLFSARNLDDDLLDHLVESGCVKISVGVEGVGDAAIQNLKSRDDLKWEYIKGRFEKAQDVGLLTRVFIMIGNEWDTVEYYEYICKELPTLAADDLRVSFTTPFPGTSLYKRYLESNKNVVPDFSMYHTEYPVLINKHMSPSELLQWKFSIIESFYQSEYFKFRVISRIKKFPNLKQPYIEYLYRLRVKGGTSNIKIDELLNVLTGQVRLEGSANPGHNKIVYSLSTPPSNPSLHPAKHFLP